MARPPSFLSELRRRKVWQVTAAYLAGALTTLLAVAELYDVFGLPDGTPRVVAAVLAGGLPVALVLGWFFDVRRDRGGGSAAAEVPASDGPPAPVEPALPGGLDDTGRESIVVLPFDNFSPQTDDAWFCDGLTEEITTDLSYIRSLRVISRTSASVLKSEGRSARDIHREHGVDYVLEGSVRKAGESIRVTAQLIRAATDEHLWAERYDGGFRDVFRVQEDVSRSIVDALELRLRPDEERRLHERPVQDLKAYEFVLRARDDLIKFTPDGLEGATRHLEAAQRLVGENPLILSGLGYVHFQRANLGLGHDEDIENARSYAERALELDPDSAQAHLVLGLVHVGADADIPGAISRFRRCLAITPDDSHALAWLLITYSLRGRVRPMEALLRRLREVDPYSPLIPGAAAHIPWMAGRYSEALKPVREWRAGGDALDFAVLFEVILLAWSDRTGEARDLVRREVPDDAAESYLRLCLIFAAAIEGDVDGVREILEGNLERIMRRDVQFAYIATSALALAGLREEAMCWARYVFDHGVVNYPWFAEHDPFLTRYRGDPEYEAILEEMQPVWEAEVAKDGGRASST